MRSVTPLFFLLVIFACSCVSQPKQPKAGNFVLTGKERHWCDSMKFDTVIIHVTRAYSSAPVEPFHYSLGKTIEKGIETESDPIYLPGFIFSEPHAKAERIVLELYGLFNTMGYSIFTVENYTGINNSNDNIAILKTTDKYTVLKQIQTDGINWDINNDSLLTIIRSFDKKYSLQLIGASGDWCEFIIQKEPKDWLILAKEAFKVCPDIVDQGTGTVEKLAEEMKRTKRLYFWWD